MIKFYAKNSAAAGQIPAAVFFILENQADEIIMSFSISIAASKAL